jgi:YVTN family beta-propeller protein
MWATRACERAIFVAVLSGISSAGATTIYTADEGQGTVSIFDLAHGPIATLPVGILPHNVDVTPDGRHLLVVGISEHTGQHSAAGALVVVDVSGAIPAIAANIIAGEHPAHVVPSADGQRAFVTDSSGNAVLEIDLKSRHVIRRVSVGNYPHGLRLSPDGKTLAIANMKDGTVSLVDVQTLTEQRRIGVGRRPVQVGFTPDGRLLLVSLNAENRLAIVDLPTGRLTRKIAVGRGPIQLIATADGKNAVVANQGTSRRPDNRVCLVALYGKAKVQHIVSGAGAHGVALSRDGSRAFVTNTVANTLTVIDVRRGAVLRSWPTGRSPNGVIAY